MAAFKNFLHSRLKAYFITGLLVVGPMGLTFIVVQWIISGMDGLLNRFLPDRLHPEQLFGFPVPGLGLLATLLIILLVGMLTANYFGRHLLTYSDRMMTRIPLVKGIYGLFKQVADTVLSSDRQGFRKVVLIEYPRKGIWSVGFVTGVTQGEIQEITDSRVINVFVPTTPNPTSGYYILVPESDARVLNMTVEEAFKLIISGGMVTPPDRRGKLTGRPAAEPAPAANEVSL